MKQSTQKFSTLLRGGIVAAVALTLASQQSSAVTVTLGNVSATPVAGSLTMAGGGILDIAPLPAGIVGPTTPQVLAGATNGLIWQAYNAVPATADANQAANFLYMYNRVVAGYDGGAWDAAGAQALAIGGVTSGVTFRDANFGTGTLGVMVYDNTLLGYTKWQGTTIADPNFRETMLRVTYTGDYNGDGAITADDFLALISYAGSASTYNAGDITGDGVITADDFLALIAASSQPYGNLGDATALVGTAKLPGSQVVPEPASGLLVLLGAGVLAGSRRKRNMTNSTVTSAL